ncbi:hypothetical protein C7H19_11990 [Aphanothece hegewaldii CCALA 016]|uniref:DUF433 domain-containing protein n=1 Tax=Aphanothece hegewaldii CCALA 016 TaxID=2107694 RepID=A0A2T1LXP3_9CHRO|nr:DUF433 domain-containing protein [Aphanothece hegewaldii]PSF37150.1 hypothetical protein C7H19_11990 [Aphanothece hegewaldii CCALA 016]
MTTTIDIGTLIVKTPDTCGGRPRIANRRLSVQQIAVLYTREKLSPEEIKEEYDGLTLAEVHAALAYYYANTEQIETYLAQEKAEYDRAVAEYRKNQQL